MSLSDATKRYETLRDGMVRIGCITAAFVGVAGLILLHDAGQRAQANPWTRDAGSVYVNLSYQRIAASQFYGPEIGRGKLDIRPFEQHALAMYSEVGVVDRWLTLTLSGQLVRHASLEAQGATTGLGDFRLGVWSGLLRAPFHLGVGAIFGIPSGDPRPDAGRNAAPGAQLIASSLPTGDGEADAEFRIAAGYSFGGPGWWWPLKHYLRAEFGYWLRTKNFANSVNYHVELGVNAPWRIIDRLWVIVRLFGTEAFVDEDGLLASFTGMGNGVTFASFGVEAFVRLWKGLGASVGFSGAFRARNLPAGAPVFVSLSYEY